MTGSAAAEPRLGWRAERRPKPAFAHVLGAAAGAFAVIAIVAFVVEVASDDATGPGVGFTGALALAALIVGSRVAGPLRSGAVAVLVLSAPLIWIFAFVGNGSASRGDVRGIYLLTVVCYAALYVAGWTKGRAIFLAGALLLFASWLSFEVAGSRSNSVIPFQNEVSNNSNTDVFGFDTENSSFRDASDTTDSTATVALLLGIVYVGAGAALDRRKLEGAATPFIAIGAFETIAGAVVLGGNQSVLLGGLLAIGAGALVGIVAARGDRRRASTWIGVVTVFGGMVAILVDISPGSAAGVGGIAVCFAVILGFVAGWLAPVLGESDDGDDRRTPSPAPPGGDVETPVDEAAA